MNRQKLARIHRELWERDKTLMEKSFRAFLPEGWKILNPGRQFIEGWYLDAICEHLQAVKQGHIRQLIINVPPRSGKSTTVTMLWPVWRWISEPDLRACFYSYRLDLALEHSVNRRTVIQSEWYQSRWGDHFELQTDQNQKAFFQNDKRGKMEVLSSATGSGGALLILDDPISVLQGVSDTERATQNQVVRTALFTRLDDVRTGATVVVMQRVHENDTTGELLASGGWTHLCLPARIDEKPEKVYFPISQTYRERPVGDLLDPVRLPDVELRRLETNVGSATFAGQYQQSPQPLTGNVVDPAWWRFYDPARMAEIRGACELCIISVDTATKASELSSDVALQAWGFRDGQSYFLGRDTRKRNFAATLAAVEAMAQRWQTTTLLVEDKSTGPAVIQHFTDKGYIVLKANPSLDKVARLQTASPGVEAGTFWLPQNADGLYLQSVCAKAPNGPMDDCDAFSQFANYVRTHGLVGGWLKAMAEQYDTEEQGADFPTPHELHAAANKLAGLTTDAPTEGAVGGVPRTRPVINQCAACGSPRLFQASRGVKCLACGQVFEYPSARPAAWLKNTPEFRVRMAQVA